MACSRRSVLVAIFACSAGHITIALFMIYARNQTGTPTIETGKEQASCRLPDGTEKCPSAQDVASHVNDEVSNKSVVPVNAQDIIGKPLVDFIRGMASENNQSHLTDTLKDDPWGYVKFGTSQGLNFHCSECALVSSSSRLLKQAAGHDIDSTLCVIRMNNHPTQKFSGDVGEKTTIRMISHVAVPTVLAERKSLLTGISKPDIVILWGNPASFESKQSHVYNALKQLQEFHPDIRFYTLNQLQYDFAETVFRRETGFDRIETKTWLSTGWFTMILALKACSKVTVYGITNPQYCSTHRAEKDLPYHYFGPSPGDECFIFNKSEEHKKESHRFLTEKYVFNRWRKLYDLSFRVPSWDSIDLVTNSTSTNS